jgi:hypothetical protein
MIMSRRWRWCSISSLVVGSVSLIASQAAAQDSPSASPSAAQPPPGSEAAPTDSASTETAPPPVASLRAGAPSPDAALDFCALKPRGSEGSYQVQRVVFMNPLISSNVVGPESETDGNGNLLGQHTTLASINAGELTRLLFAADFPMQRLYTVYSPAPASASLFGKSQLAAAELAEVTGGDGFVSYSAACADWILVPTLRRSGGTWQKVKRKKTVIVNNQSREIEYLAWNFSVGFDLELAAFKRSADGNFAKYKVITSAGVEGMFARGGAPEPHSIPLHQYVSTWPEPSCAIGQPVDGKAGGIASCRALEPKLSADLEPSATRSLCAGVDDSVGSSMTKIAGCQVSNAMESAVRVLQLHAKQDPWGMFTQLGPDLSISLGRREGAKRGDYYVAASADGRGSSGFARIVSVGPGGEEGARSPSRLKFKSGDGDVGSRMKEFPLMGVRVGAHPAAMYLLSAGDLETTLGYGGIVSLSYDASSYISVLDEFWGRVDVGYLGGSGSETFVPIDLGFQAVSYVSSGLAVDLGLGFSALVASKKVSMTAGQEESWSGTSSGAFARAAASHAFSPDWDMALGVEARSGFKSATLKNDKLPGVTVNAGNMTGALAMLSLAHTF